MQSADETKGTKKTANTAKEPFSITESSWKISLGNTGILRRCTPRSQGT